MIMGIYIYIYSKKKGACMLIEFTYIENNLKRIYIGFIIIQN